MNRWYSVKVEFHVEADAKDHAEYVTLEFLRQKGIPKEGFNKWFEIKNVEVEKMSD